MTFSRSGKRARKRLLLIDLPEETRVVETRANHALITLAYETVGIAGCISHCYELRRERAIGIQHGKVALVMAHDCGENFLGQFEIRRVKAAADGSRELGQVDERFQQILIGLDAFAKAGLNALAAFISAYQDVVVTQNLFVVRDA